MHIGLFLLHIWAFVRFHRSAIVDIATVTTPITVILAGYLFTYMIEPRFQKRQVQVVPDKLGTNSHFFATNIGTRDLILRRYGIRTFDFDSTEEAFTNDWRHLCRATGEPIELELSGTDGKYLDVALKTLLGQIYYVYVEDYAGIKYRAYPQGKWKSRIKKLLHCLLRKKYVGSETIIRQALKIEVRDITAVTDS